MSKLRSYLYVCKPAADIDCDKRSDIGDRKAVAGNKLMPVQFAIHPLEPLINYRPLRLTIFRELLEAALKDWTGVLNSAPDRSEKLKFHPAIPPLDVRLLTEVAS